jgi:TRAP-type C4-dicarboxylate transport system substrate-binding protein
VAVALVAAAAGCGGSGGDKAGGGGDGKPVVLTLESEDDLSLSGAPEFARAVERLSAGSMRIEFLRAQRSLEVQFERGLVQDVRAGKADLGIVGVRVWDTMGVNSFRALLAPLLVDSYELQRRVIESDDGERMLSGVERAGVVGIALLAGPLRRPLGLAHALLGPEDYRGETVAIRPGAVAQKTFRALGAGAKGYVPGDLAGFDAVEIDPKTVDYNGWSGTLTTNVVLWPKPYSIVMNRGAFEALTAEQQELLREAGRQALAPELDQTMRDATTALADACRRGLVTLATASSSERASLRRAVQPVYDELDRDEETRQFMGEIGDLRGGLATAALAPRCATTSGAAKQAPSPVEGRWKYTWTRPELVAVGIDEKYIPKGLQRDTVVVEFEGGRYRLIAGGAVRVKGTYTIDGDVLNLVHPPGSAGYAAGQVYRQRWSVYRGRLTFRRVPGSDADLALVVKPLTRLR